ncbi:DUF1129 family protein [Paenibacillus ihbetae]|uniref:DUF1129 domain-containing protein n=1 Tax=Paenibacillus ihbetae TaxID=1870820 RepID=A0ABX3JSB7_9BACL|nr:DUF1129 family protein [Paenibacillus ihbetae]OOC58820.1 hypothetical protein BBD40_24415 [Paenibacillus ihbetae]
MNIKQMIKENNRLQDAMTPGNLSYYQDMVVYIRSSSVNEAKGEELLLEIGQHLLDAQAKGKTAEEVFGSDPEAYCKDLVEQLPPMKGLNKLQLHVMIPWIALTWFFFVQAIAGFIVTWTGGPVERMTQVRVSTLVLLAGGSYVLIQLVMKWMKNGTFQPEEEQRKINIRHMGIYVVIAVVILVGGVWLGRLLPVLHIQPWVSLVIFVIGLLGTKLLFSSK